MYLLHIPSKLRYFYRVAGKMKNSITNGTASLKQVKRLALTFAILWTIVFLRVPHKWIGLKDGYYYSIWIKTFSASPYLQDINGTPYVSYPFYWFWIWGQIYRFFGLESPSNYYAITALASYAFGILLSYWILKDVVGDHKSYLFILFFEIYFLITNQVQIWQKPHEHFAFLISSSLFMYFGHKLTSQDNLKWKKFILNSFILGLVFGIYTPPVLIIFPALICILIINLKNLNMKGLRIFLVIFILTSLPQIIMMLKTYFRFRKTPTPMIYQITEFFPNMWIPIWLLLFGLISLVLPISEKNIVPAKIIKTMLVVLVLLYLVVQIAYFFNVIINRSDIVLIAIAIFIIWSGVLSFDSKIFTGRQFEIASILLIAVAFFANTTPLYPGADTDFRANLDISVNRANNFYLNSVSKLYDEKYCGSKVFANDELRFLPASTKCRMPMTLPFNEGNTGPDIPYQERIKQFENALISRNPRQLSSWLDHTGTDFISLVAINGHYNFDFLVNRSYPVSGTVLTQNISIEESSFKLMLPKNWRIALENSNLLVAVRIREQ